MLIKFEEVIEKLKEYSINITGVFHLGAHICEELDFYTTMGLNPSDIIWVDAVAEKVEEAKKRGIPNVYNALITDKDDENVAFNLTNNIGSSSILELGTHAIEHPHIFYTNKLHLQSITVDSFFKKNNFDGAKYNMWNFDIQGAELLALKGAAENIQYAKVLYMEVNEKELYKNCCLIKELDEFLLNCGFERVITYITHHGWGDAVYIKKN